MKVLPAATNAAKSLVRGLERFARAGDALRFSLRTRDRFGNERWSGGDGVRLMLLRASTPGGIGKAFTKVCTSYLLYASYFLPLTSCLLTFMCHVCLYAMVCVSLLSCCNCKAEGLNKLTRH